MRWGVRKYQNKDGTLTTAGKKHYKKDDIILPKNMGYGHYSIKDKIGMKNRSTYVMGTKEDMRIYGGTYATHLSTKGQTTKTNPVYLHTFKTKHEMAIAGETAMKETFNKMLANKKTIAIMKPEYDKALNNKQIKNNTSYDKFSKDPERMFKLFVNTTLNGYSVADSSGRLRDVHPSYAARMKLGEKYVKQLQKNKYAGMIDLHDKDVWYGVKSPQIVFNGQKFLEDSSAVKVPIGAMCSLYKKLSTEGRKDRRKDVVF